MRSKKSSTEVPERLSVGIEEAAEMLGVGRSSVFGLVKDGLLRSIKIGKRRLIPLTELRAFLERQAHKAG